MEVRKVPSNSMGPAVHMLLTLAEYVIDGEVLATGETIQMGPAVLTVTQPPVLPNSPFPYGLLRICDYDVKKGVPHLSVRSFLSAIAS
jgi:hypothetical protein